MDMKRIRDLEKRIAELKKSLKEAREEIKSLRNRMDVLEKSSSKTGKLPDTMLLSDQFIKRALGVWGHKFVIDLIIAVPIWVLMMLIALSVGGFR